MPDPLLQANALEKRFGGLVAVGGASLSVHANEIHAVIGPNGAGKSTLVNLLAGDLVANSGEIRLRGQAITHLPPDRRSLAGLGRSYQTTTIFPSFTVLENAELAAQAKTAGAISLFGRVGRGTAARRRALAALEETGLAALAEIAARDLSHGQQRQLEIAVVLAGDPAVLLLDEPLAGLGTREANDMVDLIRALKRARGILLIEHDMDAVFALADRLTVMVDGRVIASGDPLEVRKDAEVRRAYLGEPEVLGA
jgi:branched-chain amino acid transport system ATP-binding protein